MLGSSLLGLPFIAVELWTQFQQKRCVDYGLHRNYTQSINLSLRRTWS
jgi:hypothetical protein